MKVAVILSIVFLLVQLQVVAQVVPDTNFRYPIYQPLFSDSIRPLVLIDGTHRNLHRFETGFGPFSRLLLDAGFRAEPFTSDLETNGIPAETTILVISNALHSSNSGNWVNPVKSAFSTKEIRVIREWVRNGGSLLLIADHMPFAGAADKLAGAFGAKFINGFTGISDDWPPNRFAVPSVAVKQAYFHTDSVATFTGSAIKLPEGALNLLPFEASDTVFVSDTAWVFDHAETITLDGYSQGGIFSFGKGRVAIFGEAAMFTAQLAGKYPVGFNDPSAPENALFILDVLLQLVQKSPETEKVVRANCLKQEILEVYYAMDSLFARNEMSQIAACYSEDAQIVGNKLFLEGKEPITAYWNNLTNRGVSWNHTVLSLEVQGKTAWQTGISELEYLSGEGTETIISRVHYTIIWKQEADRKWKIFRDHYTPVPN